MNLARVLDEEILPRVDKPSRYLGTEVNAIHKDKSAVALRLALVFPDLYDIGLGNLGVHILYAVLNGVEGVWCERGYAPARDLEEELRSRKLPLFALESKDSLGVFDGIGFTLQSELTFTNILNIIDMSGIPLRTANRDDSHPLTFAGGPAVFNPEPLAPFMDFFVIGDGEDIVIEIAETMKKLAGKPRKAKLLALSLIPGVYVPALYPFETLPNGQILPKEGAPKILKRITRSLNGATFPTDYILPYTQQVHDRVSLEVLRGCTQGCRFCQAGMTTRPVRERTIDNIEQLMQRTLDATGYEEVSLVSLSTCDYSKVREMVERVVDEAEPRRVAVSLPSLRLDSYSVELADMAATTRKSGLTVAPEAASPRLRALINKWIPDEDLLKMTNDAFAKGWQHVKLYFMIGLPTERDDDIDAIADLATRTWQEGRAIRKDASAHLGVSTFVPKPFTPFQWAAQIPLEETARRQQVLVERLMANKARGGVKFGRHEPEETFLEGLVSRADRRAADLLERAFELGCRFDAWREHLRFDLWQQAIRETGYDVVDALRERQVDERLPWDHIDVMIPKQWFVEDWARAKELQHAQDCRHKRCHKCGVIDVERELCASMLRGSIDGRKTEETWVRKPRAPWVEPTPTGRLWFRIGRTGPSRFLSHLEAMNAWMRTLRRGKVPVAYTQGFHPHARVAFTAATPQGEETVGDWMDVVLSAEVDPQAVLEKLRSSLPDGFELFGVKAMPMSAPSLMQLNEGGVYTMWIPGQTRESMAARIDEILAMTMIPVEREGKRRGQSTINLRPMIRSLRLHGEGEVPAVEVIVGSVDGKNAKPRELAALLSGAPETVRTLKRDTLWRRADGELLPYEKFDGTAVLAAAAEASDEVVDEAQA